MLRPVSPSSEAVGSSRIRMSGRLTIARAIATRCCSPPLSFTGGSSARGLQADDLQVLAGFAERLVPRPLLQDQRDRDVLGGRQARKQMIVLKHEADLVQPEFRERIVADMLQMSVPSIFTRAAVRPQDAGDHAEHRGLAAAGGPDDVEHLAEIGVEAHVLDGVRPGLALAEPLVEARGLDCDVRPSLAPEDVEGLDLQDLAHADVARDRRQ